MKYFVTTREWEGQTVAVLASGPSMTREVAAAVRSAGIKTIAVNNQAVKTNNRPAMAPWADILIAADFRWWYYNKLEALAFAGRKVSIDSGADRDRWTSDLLEQLLFLKHGGVDGYDERPDYIRTGGNSGFQGVSLAIKLGAAKVLMCGFDMHGNKGEHWFGSHSWRKGYKTRYNVFINRFNKSAKALLDRAEIINTTPGSALKCFTHLSLGDALNGLSALPRETREGEGKPEESRVGIAAVETVAVGA